MLKDFVDADFDSKVKNEEVSILQFSASSKNLDLDEFSEHVINKSGLNVIAADNLSDAAKKIVSAVKGN